MPSSFYYYRKKKIPHADSKHFFFLVTINRFTWFYLYTVLIEMAIHRMVLITNLGTPQLG